MRIKWNNNSILEVSKLTSSRSEFKRIYPGAYKAAKRLNLLDGLYELNIEQNYTIEYVLNIASNYKNKNEFKYGSRVLYEFCKKDKNLWKDVSKLYGKDFECNTFSQYIEQFNIIHNYKYDYTKAVYINSNTDIIIICPEHGEFQQRPAMHKHGNGCKFCAIHGFNQNKPGILYYLSILGGQAYKIGITNRTVEERFSKEDLKNIEIISVWSYENGSDCYKQEQLILKEFKEHRYSGNNLLESGNTELFNYDVLQLHK